MFHRLDMRTDSTTLPEGTVQVSENFRFDQLGARPRGGIARQLAPGDSTTTIFHAAVYKPDSSNDRIALCLTDKLALFNPATQGVTYYDYPAAQTIVAGDSVDFIQAGVAAGTTRYAYVLRGQSKNVLSFDGATTPLTNLATFERGDFGIFSQDRIVVNDTNQSLKVSDYLDYTVWTLLNQFQILKGGDDELVGVMPYQRDYYIIGCNKRFFLAYFSPLTAAAGYSGGLSAANSWMRELTRAAGLCGKRAWGEYNGKIWFISKSNAIHAFTPQLDNELTSLGVPVSKPIQPILDNLSATYAHTSSFAALGTRLYFAMPICPDAVKISTITVNAGTATVTTTAAHNLASGDFVQIASTMTAAANGIQTVTGVTSATVFTFATGAGITAGDRATAQKVVTRPNRIAVFNTALANEGNPLGEWESIDILPGNIYADWLFVADDSGLRRRLWLVDKTYGPCLYEFGDVDETGTSTGGLTLGFTLPAILSTANFPSVPVAGRIKSRTLRWGAFPRQVKASEVRLRTADGDAGTITTRVRTPDRGEWTSTRTFDDTNSDTSARKRCGKRGLEAEIEITTSSGRPIVRSLAVETVPHGAVAEE